MGILIKSLPDTDIIRMLSSLISSYSKKAATDADKVPDTAAAYAIFSDTVANGKCCFVSFQVIYGDNEEIQKIYGPLLNCLGMFFSEKPLQTESQKEEDGSVHKPDET